MKRTQHVRGSGAVEAGFLSVYEVDPSRSSAAFSVKHIAGHVAGSFRRVEGMLHFDPGNLAATEVRITVDARTIDTGHPVRDQQLRSSGFLAVDRYPEILFVSRRADPIDGNVFELAGDLTLHGVTKPVVLRVTYLGMATAPDGQKQAVFDARAHVSRREFDMSLSQVLELGGFLVSDKIDLTFDIHASQAETPP